ncbi:hypothetical protein DRH29_01865 [candidate division Kazan bacterium]|uniref:Small-conductance mechanosensitive ion channel n=1 Tax=candidate division Kazan bacterium TaxID=2202143 RepID=A0A420ZCX2_UNCK3|nr:MAG: hypothetical protein DRH29_01865 [candidate division Kazan bacterium]
MQENLFAVWGNAVLNPLEDIWGRFLVFLPNLVGAVIILLVGWIVAVGLDRLVTQILKQLRVDAALNRVGTKTLFEKSGFELEVSEFVGALVKWTILLVAFLAAADVLGLSKVTDFLNQILVYIPNVFVAIAILLIGVLAAHFFAGLVRGAVGAAKVHAAQFLAATTKWVIYIFTILVALNQLGIAASIVDRLITAIFFMVALAGGLAFGLGGQKAASETLDDIRKEVGHKK